MCCDDVADCRAVCRWLCIAGGAVCAGCTGRGVVLVDVTVVMAASVVTQGVAVAVVTIVFLRVQSLANGGTFSIFFGNGRGRPTMLGGPARATGVL